MNNFLYKLLTNDGHEVYTHELTHMLDKTIWLNGYGRRSGQLQEVFARGLFESRNMSLPQCLTRFSTSTLPILFQVLEPKIAIQIDSKPLRI